MSGERYRVLRELGVGGMGVVELVHDSVRGEDVARKRILDATPEALLRFKREFRAIEALRHPNVVALYELGEDEKGPYFTMEHVEGKRLTEFCAPGVFTREVLTRTEVLPTELGAPIDRGAETRSMAGAPPGSAPTGVTAEAGSMRCDLERVDLVLSRIVSALSFLHGRGVVHCDLKPSNVLVREDGVVKLLDFGVVAEMRGGRREAAAGTPEYMAPERLRGAPATPAVDAYALGVTLFELMTGRRPFVGSTPQVVSAHLRREPPRLDEIARDAPAKWTELCASLLVKDPERRRTIADLSREQGVAFVDQKTGAFLVGREAAQRWLAERWRNVARGAFDHVYLTGPTGSGKTALAEWLATQGGRERAIVLRGRARPSERIVFNAVDGAIDDLARALRSVRSSAADAACAVAAHSFPVLSALEAAQASAVPSRADAFGAIVALLKELAGRRPIVIVLDDLQWADVDSLALVEALIEHAPRRVMIVATMRFDVREEAATAWVKARAAGRELPVPPLRPSDVAKVIEHAAGDAPRSQRDQLIASLVTATEGLPALAEVAGRLIARGDDAISTLSDALRALVRGATKLERDALALIVAYEDWLTVDELVAMLDAHRGAVDEACFSLERNALVRRTTEGAAWRVDTYHDTVRVAVLAVLDEADLALAHARLAKWLRSAPAVPVYRLVRHLDASGAVLEAAQLAREAARLAEEQSAYGFAAEMYEMALRVEGAEDRRALLARRGRMLERIGAYAKATECWREIADASDGDERLDAAIHEAECLLGSSDVVAGYRRLDETFRAMGRPSIRSRSYWELVRFAIGPILAPRSSAAGDDVARAHAEREISAAQLVSYFDPLAGVTMLSRARRGFVASGAGEAAAACELMSAVMAYFGASAPGPVPIAERYRRCAEARFRGREMPRELRLFLPFLDGYDAMRRGEWARAEAAFEEAISRTEIAGLVGSHGHMFGLATRAELELWRQDFHAYVAQNRRFRAASRDAGRGPLAYQLAQGEIFERAISGDLDDARALCDALDARWPKDPPTIQRFLLQATSLIVARLRRRPDETWSARCRLEAAMEAMGSAATYSRAFDGLIAQADLVALHAGLAEPSVSSIAKRAKRAAVGLPLFRARSRRTLAYIEERAGRLEVAVELLERAEREAEACGHPLEHATSRYQRGRLIGGDEGARLQSEGRRLLAATGAAECWLEEWPP